MNVKYFADHGGKCQENKISALLEPLKKTLLMGKAASSLLIIPPLGELEERDVCHQMPS